MSFLLTEQKVNERVTVLTDDETMFIFGGKNIMQPDKMFNKVHISPTDS
jgi:hypothetical protein